MKKIALSIFLALLLASPALAQPVTTKPNVSNLLAQCSANTPVVGNGSGVSPICHASGALGALSFVTPGTGVATALGVNVGSAGSPVVNGGVLGSPSSAGTMPAFTLGGTISGGGNQINNVVIGTVTPLAGSFTTLGSSGVSTLLGNVAIGANLAPDANLTINANTGAATSPPSATYLHIVGADAAIPRVTMDAFGAPPVFGSRYANGTLASKTVAINGSTLFAFGASGWNGSAYVASSEINFIANETFSGTASGGYVFVKTTPLTTTGDVESTRFQPSGGVSIGAAAIAADPGIGNLNLTGFLQSGAVAVASLPACNAARKGARHFVTDNNTALAFAAVITSGGAIQTPVYCDGTTWRQG